LEMLAVIVIATILLALITRGVGHLVEGSRLTQAGANVVDEINYARAVALARNDPAEVWFLRLPSEPGGMDLAYRAVRSRVLAVDGSTSWISRTQRLPDGIVISPSKERSNCIGGQIVQAVSAAPEVVDGVGIRIYPNGRTEAVNPAPTLELSDPLFLTIGRERDIADTGSSLPPNFIVVQIEPRNGRVTTLRP